MRIGVDSRPLREAQTSGIPMYVRSLLRSLAELDKKNEYILYAHKEFEMENYGPQFSQKAGAKTKYGSVWMQAELPFWLKRDKVDIFWGTQHLIPLALPKNIKAVLTVHDLVHFVFPKTMKLMNLIINKLLIPPSIDRTDAIVADTGWTLQDVKIYLNPQNKIMEVAYLGIGSQFTPRDKNAARKELKDRFGMSVPYLLTVGTFEPRKNIIALIRAFSLLADKIPHDLVIVGQRGWKNKNALAALEQNPAIKKRIHLLGYVPDEHLPEIYSGADLFIFPSLYEGFGLPPLEAMACGIPVVCSNVSSIPEIVDGAAKLVNPNDPSDIARGILEVIQSPEAAKDLIEKGKSQAARFQWNETAKIMLRVFDEVAGHK